MNPEEAKWVRQVASKAERKLVTARAGRNPVWLGVAMLGLVGWSVAIPTLLGTMLGMWWDRRHPGARSATLILLLGGLMLGCANACYWLSNENKAIHQPPRREDE